MSPFPDVISKKRVAKARDHMKASAATGKSATARGRLLLCLALAVIWGLCLLMAGQGTPGGWTVKCVQIGGALITLLACGQLLIKVVAPGKAAASVYLPLMLCMLLLSHMEIYLNDMAFSGFVAPMLGDVPEAAKSVFAYPNAIIPMLVAMLYGGPAALAIGIVTSAAFGVAASFKIDSFLIGLCATCVIAKMVPRMGSRRQIAATVAMVGGLQFIMVLLSLFRLWRCGTPAKALMLHAGFFYASLVVSVLVFMFVLLPLAERVTQRVSNVTLGAYANLESPLLRRLSLEAPGTYHHVMMVGDIAQAAADAIGANGLLARVGAYYHDIGKLGKPLFFMENQSGGENPHDKFRPNISRIILLNHVKEGQALAKIHGLPSVLHRFIATHHGTSVARWFLIKELKRQEGSGPAAGDEAALESFFRYPGPLPVTREETIVSLADSVEAASRAMRFFDRDKIESLVNGIVRERWIDGQLAKSELTNADLDLVRKSFVTTLVPLLHGRLPYPPKNDPR